MSDVLMNQFVARGTAAERGAFTPDPPTAAAGPDHGYLWYETDTGDLYAWDGSGWQSVNLTGGGQLRTADPSAPPDDTWWFKRTGSGPYEITLCVRIDGATEDIPIYSLPT